MIILNVVNILLIAIAGYILILNIRMIYAGIKQSNENMQFIDKLKKCNEHSLELYKLAILRLKECEGGNPIEINTLVNHMRELIDKIASASVTEEYLDKLKRELTVKSDLSNTVTQLKEFQKEVKSKDESKVN